jgi:endonuclease/exonuclease/phosphatase family metal-dependent hydrolase
MQDAADLSLATWNIHGGVGNDGRYDAERVIAVLGEIGADIVALQEVPSLSLHGQLLKAIQATLGMHVAIGRTLTRGEADYGNAVLSRFPISAHATLELTVPPHEPRNAVDILVHRGDRLVRVVGTHLGLRPAERRVQVQRILAAVDARPEVPTALMGDINEWYLWGRPLRWLHARFRTSRAPRTFPARAPMLALDRIWAHPPAVLRDLRVHRSPASRMASDHLPLVASMTFAMGTGTAPT